MTIVTARERLLEAAVEAFAEKGFTATTTRDIASRAGMSPAAVYVHHDTKENLLFTVSVEGLPGARLWLVDQASRGNGSVEVEVEPDRLREIKVFVSRPGEIVEPGSTPFSFVAVSDDNNETAIEATEFIGPDN